MAPFDFRGARGSNAGDDFHELWALRAALALLDPEMRLREIAVEGLSAEDEAGQAPRTWDGVDCTLYYGGEIDEPLEMIEIVQVKYSSASPNDAWTVSRLTRTTNKKRDNSVLGKLAMAYSALSSKYVDLAAAGKVVVKLVSNQPIATEVMAALPEAGRWPVDSHCRPDVDQPTIRAKLVRASGLSNDQFDAFARALDLSQCGHSSRFALEENIVTTVAQWTGDSAGSSLNRLRQLIRRKMMPDEARVPITSQSLLSQFDCSDRRALFPCPPILYRVAEPVPRHTSRVVVDLLIDGQERVCLHGEGGCGKTTVLQEIDSLLPDFSKLIVFDATAGGHTFTQTPIDTESKTPSCNCRISWQLVYVYRFYCRVRKEWTTPESLCSG